MLSKLSKFTRSRKEKYPVSKSRRKFAYEEKIMRWTSWLLTMAMVVTMLPGLSMLASAAEEEQHADVVAWNDTDNDGVIDEGETTYETLNTALNAGGTVKLYKDYEASDEGDILVAKDTEETLVVTLDLNGKTLSSTSGYFLDLYNTNFTIPIPVKKPVQLRVYIPIPLPSL